MARFADLFKAMRPSNWYKATIVLAGPLFSGGFFGLDLIALTFAFWSFAIVASATYILNDLKDREQDQRHPKKKKRPIAAGKITESEAKMFFGVLLILGLGLGWMAGAKVFFLVTAYFVINLAYTYALKQIVIIDAFTIAVGYLLRAFAGCYAVGIVITEWFYLAIFSLAVYLAFCKRLAEIRLSGVKHKASLREYEEIVDIAIAIMGSITLTLFAIYVAKIGGMIVWSFPFAVLGILLHLRESSRGNEVHDALKNPEMILVFLGFVIMILVGLYA